MKSRLRIMTMMAALMAGVVSSAQTMVDYSAGIIGNASSGEFAPYYIGALNGGKIVRASSALLDVAAKIDYDRNCRFSWGAGVELVGGYSSANSYDHWFEDTKQWGGVSNRPAAAWIQQLYGEVKYRSVFGRVGQKQPKSALLDESLSSGDLTRSSNARGIPGIASGFIDYQDVPFTNGWVQIDGEIEYGIFTDDGFKHDQFNHYNYLTTGDVYYTYKRCYFRTMPSQPFSVVVGMQTAGQFGGSMWRYYQGELGRETHRGFKIGDAWNMFLPSKGGSDGYVEGNALGTWDFKARYRLRNGGELSFAFQWPWEDGSAIGRRNGWDGLYGLYYHAPKRGWLTGAAVEYLDFRNHSGPIHWAPNDFLGTTITDEATGGDDYYNNETFGSFSNYGMAIATPFLVAPIYNLDGFSGFAHNRARGFHAAVNGCLGRDFEYSVKYSYQQAWGRGRVPAISSLHDNSLMVAASWNADRLAAGLKVDAKVAFDSGNLRGDNFGVLVGVTYSGNLILNKHDK